jgi:ATP phosphoribosyltransferase regulatory subunit
MQVGLESFGRTDREAANAEVLDLTLQALMALNLTELKITISDMGILQGIFEGLQLSAKMQRRLQKGIVNQNGEAAIRSALAGSERKNSYAGLRAALKNLDQEAAQRSVEDILALAGLSQSGGRTASNVAARFLEQFDRPEDRIDARTAEVLRKFLNIQGHPDIIAVQIRQLAREYGLDLEQPLSQFETRCGYFSVRNIDVDRLNFSGHFARNLDYYTGFIFEIHDPARPHLKQLGGGGRYDGLMRRLGATKDIPAVGCSLWMDRLLG